MLCSTRLLQLLELVEHTHHIGPGASPKLRTPPGLHYSAYESVLAATWVQLSFGLGSSIAPLEPVALKLPSRLCIPIRACGFTLLGVSICRPKVLRKTEVNRLVYRVCRPQVPGGMTSAA